MTRRQHHKGKKRLSRWHRGKEQARRWQAATLPDLGTGAGPSGAPVPLRRKGKQNRGDTF